MSVIVETKAAEDKSDARTTLDSIDPSHASAGFIERVPIEFARERLVISQGSPAPAPGPPKEDSTTRSESEIADEGFEIIAFGGDPDSPSAAILAHNLSVRLGRRVELVAAEPEAVRLAVDALATQTRAVQGVQHTHADLAGDDAMRESGGDSGGLTDRDVRAALEADERDLLKTAGRAPIVRLANALLFEALAAGASDVHIQPAPGPRNETGSNAAAPDAQIVVRFRVDGALFDARRLPRRLLEPIVSRVKVMAHLDIAEKRLPQDGRANVTIGEGSSSAAGGGSGGRDVDLRVSTLPTAKGERVVIRLLDKRNSAMFDLSRLGMPDAVRSQFEAACRRPYGMVLATGPTGSGKTTTLYSALRLLARPDVNVLTLEDPVEYELPGISQAQINAKKGVTFATGLRHLLRQDPDVIMVGEIRDGETARTAVQAALTGHMVFSTLHTNDAASAVVRLVDLDVEPYLVNACLSAVLAQRLVRTLCPACRGKPPEGDATSAPCRQCRGSGFRGRVGLYELLVLDERLKDLVAKGASATELEREARKRGMTTLRDAGLALVAQGRTTREEVDRVTLAAEDDIVEPSDTPASHSPGVGVE